MANKKKVEVVNTPDDNVPEIDNKKVSTAETTKSIKREFKDSDYILCRSVWSGGLHITCKSGASYDFNDYNSECDIEYRDLIYLIRKNSDHIFTPRFIITDEDFLAEFPQIQKLYSSMYTPTELHKIIELPTAQMKSEIEKLPEATKRTLLSLIATEISRGKLDSIKKVRVLSEIFDSDFNLLSELFTK